MDFCNIPFVAFVDPIPWVLSSQDVAPELPGHVPEILPDVLEFFSAVVEIDYCSVRHILFIHKMRHEQRCSFLCEHQSTP